MKIEKNIHKTELKAFLQKNYGLKVKNLTFVPKGEVAYSYIVKCFDGAKYFFKIYDKDSKALYDISSLNINVELIFLLRKAHQLTNICYPIKNLNGDFISWFKKLYFCVLFNFINGIDLGGPPFKSHDIKKIAQLLACTHGIPLNHSLLQRFEKEDFGIDYVVDGIESFFKHSDRYFNAIQRELNDYLKANKNYILDALKNLQRVRKIIRRKKIKFVLTHGDPIPNNFLKDKNANLYLIDWESTKYAPRERDIWFYIEHPRGRFLKEYRRISGCTALNIDIIEFYLYLRHLGDLVHWVKRIFSDKNSFHQSKNDLVGIKADCNLQKLKESFKNMKIELEKYS